MAKQDNNTAIVFAKVKNDIEDLNARVGALEEQPTNNELSSSQFNSDIIYDAVRIAFRNVLKERDNQLEEENSLSRLESHSMNSTELTECVANAVSQTLNKKYNDNNYNVSDLSLAMNNWLKEFNNNYNTRHDKLIKVMGELYGNNQKISDDIHLICNALNQVLGSNLKTKSDAIRKPDMSNYSNLFKYVWECMIYTCKVVWYCKWLRAYLKWGKWIVWVGVIIISYFILQDNARLNVYREKYYLLHNACQKDEELQEMAEYIDYIFCGPKLHNNRK